MAIFVYNTKNGRLISKLDNGLRTGQTFLNDTTFAPDGSAYVTDSVNPVLYRVAPTMTGQYELQEFLKFEGTPVAYVNAPGAEGINVNGIVAISEMLKVHRVEFIVADPGSPLKRIPVDKCYEFWESEVKDHLLNPHGKVDRFKLRDEYGYLASEWSGNVEVPIVLLEKIH